MRHDMALLSLCEGWCRHPKCPVTGSPLLQVPPSIPRPDYAETGIPYSEMESKQQSMGG